MKKALNAAAERLGLSREDLDELGVPTFGFASNRERKATFGDAACTLKISGRKICTSWTNKGNPIKSPPAGIKREYSEALKELKATTLDAEKMLGVIGNRIDNMMLSEKTWPLSKFRTRYMEHPLVSSIACRIIWTLDGTPVIFSNDKFVEIGGEPVIHGQTAEVALWHPVTRSMNEIQAWRNRLESLQITQPFKQAHREIYLLTDAERVTNMYSNRFAAHIIKQHQFNALCAIRGWKNKLRLMVDDSYPPAAKELPAFGLRAEFWIEGIGDNYGTDTNESGVYLRLSTDQVLLSHRCSATYRSCRRWWVWCGLSQPDSG